MTIDGCSVLRFLRSGRVQLRDNYTGNIFTVSLAVDSTGLLRIA